MSVIIETRSESAVTETDKGAYAGSYIERGKTVIESDMKKRDWQKILNTESEVHRYKTYIRLMFMNFPLFTARSFTDLPWPGDIILKRTVIGNILHRNLPGICSSLYEQKFSYTGFKIMYKQTDK